MSLELSHIRETLIRQEDTIIFALIERAQFKRNGQCYAPSAEPFEQVTGRKCSFLEFMLLETERLHARLRRYTAPDEYAFFPHRLPLPALPVPRATPLLHPCSVNCNADIMEMYLHKVLPAISEDGDDGQYGSTVTADVAAISKRVHYGMFVAESKWQQQPDEYARRVRAGDEKAIMELLTHAAVEERVLRRVRRKASIFGQDIWADDDAPAEVRSQLKLDPEAIVSLYRDFVIPLTKEAEVRYLLQRLGNTRICYAGAPGGACHQLARQYASESDAAPSLDPCASVAEVGVALLSNRAFFGVGVLEHGDGGGVLPEIRKLLHETDLKVVRELSHEARFRAVAKVPIGRVRTVCAHADTIEMCRAWLRELASSKGVADNMLLEASTEDDPPWASRIDDADHAHTAYIVDAAAPVDARLPYVAEVGHVASARARYVVLCTRQQFGPSTGHDKTMALFTLAGGDEAGTLGNALATFAAHGVNLTRIQSSSDAEGGAVSFFVEMHGHVDDPHVREAFNKLRVATACLKVVGSFPRA